MSGMIPFPKNYPRYLQLGHEAKAAGQLPQALEYYQAAYECQQSLEANRAIVEILLLLEDYPFAKEMMDEWRANYLQTSSTRLLYGTALLGDQQFTATWVLLNSPVFNESDRSELMEKLLAAEGYYRLWQPAHLATLLSSRTQVPKQFSKQVDWLNNFQQLPKREYIQTASYLVKQPDLFPLNRSMLCEELVKLTAPDVYTYRTLAGETATFCPSEYVTIKELTSYQGALEMLQEISKRDGLVIAQQLQSELVLSYALFYPQVVEPMKDGQAFARALLAAYTTEKRYQVVNQLTSYAPLLKQIQSELARMMVEE